MLARFHSAVQNRLMSTATSRRVGYVGLGNLGFALVGSSPEILVRIRDGEVTIRPIAGTRPRGKTPQEDLDHEQSLLADPKER